MAIASLRERPLLITLAFIQFSHVMDFIIMMPLSPLFTEEFGITSAQFGMLVASYSISAGIVSFTAAFFVDRFDRRKVMLLCYAGFVVGTFACSLAPAYGFLLAARIFTGMFGGVLSAVLLSVVSDVVPLERRASAMGLVMSGFAAASIFGIPVGSYVASHFSWHVPFFAIGVLGVIVFSGIFFFIPSMTGHIEEAKRRKPGQTIKEILSSTNRLRALLLMTLLMFGHFSIIPYIPNYMVYNIGIAKEDIAYIYLVGGLCSVVVLRVVGKLSDRFGSFRVFATLSVLALLPIFLITNLHPHVGLGMVLLATSFVFIFGGSRSVPSNTLITSTALPHQRGGFLSLNAATQQLAAGLAALIGGLMTSVTPDKVLTGYPNVGWFAAGASLLAIPVAYLIRPVEKTSADSGVVEKR